MGDEPRSQVHSRSHQGAGRRYEAGSVSPGQPHLLAGGVECHGESGEHPVSRPEGRALQEEPGLGVDEGRRGTVRDRDALGRSGGAGGEDDPRVVVDGRRRENGRRVGAGVGSCTIEELDGRGDIRRRIRRRIRVLLRPGIQSLGGDEAAAAGDDADHLRFPEDEVGALLRVVGVDGHVGGTRGDDAEDGDVQLPCPGLHADADSVAPANAGLVQASGRLHDGGHQLPVAEGTDGILDRRRVRMLRHSLSQHVEQGAGRGCLGGAIEHSGERCGHWFTPTRFEYVEACPASSARTPSADRMTRFSPRGKR